MRAPVTLDLHLPNFNYPGITPDQLFEQLVEIARTAEESGFSSVTVMDHLHQIRGVGPPTNWMLEGNTVLGGLAARTSQRELGLLVGGVTYRNPALLAKITTTLDIVSRGRAVLGLGAAWNEEEHVAYGIFPPLSERFERLEDALKIARAMFTRRSRARRPPPQHGQGAEQPAAAARRHPDPGRRQRRAQDAAPRGAVRRRLQRLRRRRAARATCWACSTPTATTSAATRPRSPRRAMATM